MIKAEWTNADAIATDYISRQTAIDVFMASTSDGDKFDWCKSVLTQVPSAQSEVITCKDCKYRVQISNGYYPDYYCGYEYDRCDPYEMTRRANDPNYFCADAERRTGV